MPALHRWKMRPVRVQNRAGHEVPQPELRPGGQFRCHSRTPQQFKTRRFKFKPQQFLNRDDQEFGIATRTWFE